MTDKPKTAGEWVEFLADSPAVPFRSPLRSHFAAGHITRLCDCGCDSFDLEIPPGTILDPLCAPSENGGGMFFEVVFESSAESDVACLFFAEARGYLAGIDITYGEANHAPFPPGIRVGVMRYTSDRTRN